MSNEEDGGSELCTPLVLRHGLLKLLKALAKRHGPAKQGITPDNGSLSVYITVRTENSSNYDKSAWKATVVCQEGLEFCGKGATG